MEEITTVQQLIGAFSNNGSLQAKLEVYDVRGFHYKITDVYPADDDPDTVCIDVERHDD